MSDVEAFLPPEVTDRLRDDLGSVGYTVDAVRDVLGSRASAALDRNETTPGLAATGSPADDALAGLVRLWPLQTAVPTAQVRAALSQTDALLAAGVLRIDTERPDHLRAVVDVRPYADDAHDWWVLADLTPGLDGARESVPDDHVLGINAASSTLAQLTVRRPVGRALDLGTGCGVQALHLAQHADTVIGTDVNERALAMAAVTARLNGLTLDLRLGSMFDPVADEQLDLIATNPPFVVSPGGHHVYRDSGFVGDEATRRVVVDGAARLAPGGRLQALANWVHVRGTDWAERVGAWVDTTGCDAWIVQREVQDPAEYVELWLRDSGEIAAADYPARYDAWLRWFDENDVEGIGFGWVNLLATGRDQPTVELEDWPHAVAQPLGAAVGGWFDRAGRLPAQDTALLSTRLQLAGTQDPGPAAVVQEQIGVPGEEDPEHLVLRQRTGLMRARQVGTEEAGLVGACDGTVALGPLLDAVATVCEVDPTDLRRRLLPRVRELVLDGFLEVVPG